MKALERRLQKMEAIQKLAPTSKTQIARQLNDLIAKNGTTKEEVIAEHGSVSAYCHFLMCQADGKSLRQPSKFLTAQEEYMQMLQKG